MNEIKHIKKRLERFGLTEKQAEVYTLLLRQGNLRVSEITKALRLPRSSVYEILKGLFGLGLAEEIVENSYKVIQAYPLGSLQHHLAEQLRNIQQQSQELKHLERSLAILPALQARPAIVIRYYKGQAGARQLLWNTLKANDTLYVTSEWGRGRYVGIEFYKKFVAESQARNVQERVITNSSSQVLESIRQHHGTPVSRSNLDTIRCFDDQGLPIKGETFMYDNIYAYIDLKNDRISGFEIESQPFVRTQRAIFETLWQTATPLIELL